MRSSRFALLSPPGLSAVATLAIEGSGRKNILHKIFQSNHRTSLKSGLFYGQIVDNGEIIDHVIVARDHMAERSLIHCHGGPRILQRIMQLLQDLGAEAATWKTLKSPQSIQDEMTYCLPDVKTKMGVLAICAQSPGGLNRWAENTLQQLQTTRALPATLTDSAKTIGQTYELAKRLFVPPQVILAGPTNAGKSSLANTLTGRQQSLVADLDGTTRDWTSLLTDVQGLPIELIDSPGRRESIDRIEQAAIGVAKDKMKKADLILLVVESGIDEPARIEQAMSYMPPQKEVLILINKSDRLASQQLQPDLLYVSAKTGANLDSLRTSIADHFGFKYFDVTQPLVFTERQHNIIRQLSNTKKANSAIKLTRSLIDPRREIRAQTNTIS